MSIESVRLTLVPKGADEESAATRQIVLDLRRDTTTGKSNGPFPAFGRIGDFRRPETLYPFTLMMDGRLDTGAHAADEARQSRLEIRDAALVEDGDVALIAGDASETFVIRTMTRLLD